MGKNIKKYLNFIKTNELFDSLETEFKVIIDDIDEYKVEFEYKNDTYFFQARYENKIEPKDIRYGWHLSFGKGYNKDKYDLTNKGYSFKIISIIKKVLNIFIEKYNPNKMSFIAEGKSKANIYLSFFKNNYKIKKEESGLESYSGKTPWLFKLEKINYD